MGAHRIHHIGIAVRDLDSAVAHHEKTLRAVLVVRRVLADQRVEAAALKLPDGNGEVELIAPIGSDDDAPICRFLERRGEGLHHVAYAVADIEAELARMAADGARLIDTHGRPGLHGVPVAFVHPAGMYGVLTELVQVP